MTKNKPSRFTPDALAELLERTRQDVQRYRRLHPEWHRAPADDDPSAPSIPSQTPAKPLL
ncbi:hypothetical protein [Pseudomonas sp. TMP25]|uniref:hypothetical protein n=1 Tax=Pseudomonas sp. TMP25 TaxID=3136561 RepID=UPI003101A86C